jgi:hypothetical protein
MTLLARTTARRTAGASLANRLHTEATGRRVEEIGTVDDIKATYREADRSGDLEMESWFQRHYAAATSEEARAEIVGGFLIWQRTERREELAVITDVDDATALLRDNNDFWLGAYVPQRSGDAA